MVNTLSAGEDRRGEGLGLEEGEGSVASLSHISAIVEVSAWRGVTSAPPPPAQQAGIYTEN